MSFYIKIDATKREASVEYQPSVVIVKPVNGRCPLSCSYCYMRDLLEPHRSSMHEQMSAETLQATIDLFCSQSPHVEFVWHGGEPLLAGKRFYRDVIRMQKQWQTGGVSVANCIQTSGQLMDNEWLDILSELKASVGVSIDAPQQEHDRLRMRKDQRDSCVIALETIRHLKKSHLFAGVSCCVGRKNYQKAVEVLDFFTSQDIWSIKFLRIDRTEESISPEEFSSFLIDVFEEWQRRDDTRLEVTNLQSTLFGMLGGRTTECNQRGKCWNYATVYSDGSIYPCDSFLNDPALFMGSVHDDPRQVRKIISKLPLFAQQVAVQKRCEQCRWHSICAGGCLRAYYQGENTSGIMPHCHANQVLFSHIHKRLIELGMPPCI